MGIKTTSFGKVELDTTDYRNFLLGADRDGYILPVTEGKVHVASELPAFFERAQIALEDLLSQIKPDGKPVVVSDREQIMREFHLLGHGKTGTNEQGKLTGWSGDMLNAAGTALGLRQSQDLNLDDFYLRFVSDLPRAIHHALLLKGDFDLVEQLRGISQRVTEEISLKGNLYDVKIYHELMELALANGFIPTPELRGQYYGPMELGPEKLKPEDKDKFVAEIVERTRQNFIALGTESEFSERRTRQEAEDFAEALIHRKDLLFAHRDKGGRYVTEDRYDLMHRLTHFYDTVSQVSLGNRVLAVTSSGCIDVSPSYFRYLEDKARSEIQTPAKKVRGKVVVVKFGKYDGKDCFLNDPEKAEAVRRVSLGSVAEQRKAAFDEDIKKSTEGAIIPVELLRFERKTQGGDFIYEPHAISIEEVLDAPEPTLWLGNFGQGKSTAALELTERLNAEGNYVAVLITARDINRGLHNSMGDDPEENERTVLNLLSRGVASLPKSLRDENNIVFVIDALDEVLNYRDHVLHAAKDPGQLREYGKVIVTSRFLPELHEHENPGFTTLHVDPQAVPRNIDKYLASRVAASDRERFKEFLMQQDEGVKTNYLLVYFLTNIYKKRPQELGNLEGTVSEGEVLLKGIEVALWDNKLHKRQDLTQVPRPYKGQPEGELASQMREYERIRTTNLGRWVGLAEKIASHMTVHDQRAITRREIEELVSSTWSLAKYATELKGR